MTAIQAMLRIDSQPVHFQTCPLKKGRHTVDLSKHMLPKQPHALRTPQIPVVEQPQPQVMLFLGGQAALAGAGPSGVQKGESP